ncbi:glycosyltransferase family 4 protein [Patescibacteria group bacterium]|nr:glycosyltransferase family 4 protein [Patescibacteria group bacterium]
MKICYITQQYGNYISGVGTYSTNLINAVAEQGNEVIVICPQENFREFSSLKVRLIEVQRKKWDPSHGNWFTLSFQFSQALKKLLRNNHFDIIHFTDAREFFWTKLLFGKINSPIIGTTHDDIFMSSSKNIFFYKKTYNDWVKRYVYYNTVKVIENSCLRKLDSIIAVSDHINKRLIDVYKIDEKKVFTIYNGIKLNCEKLEKDETNTKKDNHILIIGNNLQRKGIITLFNSLNLVKERYSDLKIIAIGNDQNQKYLEEYALKIGISGRVEFKGKKSNKYVIRKMKSSLLYVMPSIREGFGITFLEAMSSRLPVISGNVGGPKELIINEENGFLVNPGDFKDLADKISILIDDDKVRNRFVENGLETVKNFSVQKMVDRTYKIYLQLVK